MQKGLTEAAESALTRAEEEAAEMPDEGGFERVR